MPSSTLIIMDVYLLYLSLWQEPEDMRGCEGEYCRVICQSNQILYTPLHSGMHTAETSGGPELNQAERGKKEATHEAYRATGWVQMESVKMEKRSERSIFYLCMLTLHSSPLAWWVQPFLCCCGGRPSVAELPSYTVPPVFPGGWTGWWMEESRPGKPPLHPLLQKSDSLAGKDPFVCHTEFLSFFVWHGLFVLSQIQHALSTL